MFSSVKYECDNGESSAEPLLEKIERRVLPSFLRKHCVTISIAAITFVVLSAAIWTLRGHAFWTSTRDGSCMLAAARREWRSLNSRQRLEYLRAVKCLSTIPSNICNGTLHDEFAYIHRNIGDYSHEAAPFLPWHRYFIHIYEQTLKERCHYTGTLPYWDWTQDWANLTQAPIWSAVEGFGGNGDSDHPAPVGGGYCVQDGPFAGLQVQYYNEDWRPHCLSRGFLAAESYLEHFGAHRLNSSAIASVLDIPDYFRFLLMLEDGPHSAIPIIVRGDFSRFTAPNDPIFFLHHAQLDRLWWQWQSAHPDRTLAYHGPSRHNSTKAAQLTDLIEMAGLAPNVQVSSVMATNSRLLCYEYQD
ncbi:putative tyrosinase [Astrocystis sublimbata]|nr:putative tyrosinase [Astrocystis sublimbata]